MNDQHHIHVHAPAKLNLVLAVGARREDGFHPLISVMEAIDLCDTLHVNVSRAGVSGVRVAAPGLAGGDTLVTRAVQSLLDHLHVQVSVDITIDKVIPVGAGLGGGSSDAAAGLCAVNTLLGAPCDLRDLQSIAATIGSDVPFFIDPQYGSLVEGRGELVRPLTAGTLPDRAWLIAWPGTSNPTGEVYQRYVPARTRLPDHGSVIADAVAGRFHNDLAEPAAITSTNMLKLMHRIAEMFQRQPLLVAGSGTAVAVEISQETADLVHGVVEHSTLRALGWSDLAEGMEGAVLAVARSWRKSPDW